MSRGDTYGEGVHHLWFLGFRVAYVHHKYMVYKCASVMITYGVHHDTWRSISALTKYIGISML